MAFHPLTYVLRDKSISSTVVLLFQPPTATIVFLRHTPAVPLKLKKFPCAKCTNCSHLQWKFKEISWAYTKVGFLISEHKTKSLKTASLKSWHPGLLWLSLTWDKVCSSIRRDIGRSEQNFPTISRLPKRVHSQVMFLLHIPTRDILSHCLNLTCSCSRECILIPPWNLRVLLICFLVQSLVSQHTGEMCCGSIQNKQS